MRYFEVIHDILARQLDFDVIVYGGSYSGLAVAYLASKMGMRVALVERYECITPYAYYGGLWGYVVSSRELAESFFREIRVNRIRLLDETVVIESMELYTRLLNAIYDNGGYVFLGFNVEPYFTINRDNEELELLGVIAKRGEGEAIEDHLVIKSRYIVDASGLEAELSQYVIERLKPPIIPQGPGPVIPGSRDVVTSTLWVIEDSLVASGLAAASIFGLALPYPDVSPLIESGFKAVELILDSRSGSKRPKHVDKYIPGVI